MPTCPKSLSQDDQIFARTGQRQLTVAAAIVSAIGGVIFAWSTINGTGGVAGLAVYLSLFVLLLHRCFWLYSRALARRFDNYVIFQSWLGPDRKIPIAPSSSVLMLEKELILRNGDIVVSLTTNLITKSSMCQIAGWISNDNREKR
jgi:hypothetical protein